MKYNLEEVGEITQYFTECMETVNEVTHELFEEISEICRQYKYEPIYNMIKELETYYKEQISEGIEKAFEDWKDSEGSVAGFVIESETSDDKDTAAVAAAKDFENDLQDVMEDTLKKYPELEEIELVTSMTKDLSDIFEDVMEIINGKKERYEELMGDSIKYTEDRSEDNLLYSVAQSMILFVQKLHEALYDHFYDGAENLKENKEDHTENALNRAQEESEKKVMEAEQAAEDFMDYSKLWDLD